MASIRASFSRLAGLLRGGDEDRDLADELNSHLQAHIDDNLDAGMTQDEARRHALLKLGGIHLAAEQYRERRGLPFLETTMQDLRYALRMFRKTPGFVAAAVLTLALGIGANTAIFSVLNAVILKPLGYPRPDRLMKLASQFPGFDEFWISAPEFLEFREWTRAFSSVGAYTAGEANLSAPDRPQRVRVMAASDDLFRTLGVGARLGRTFDASETVPGGAQVALLSHDLWQSAFGGDPSLVGRAIELDGVRRTVVGIMPQSFDVADLRTQIWLPLVIDRATANRGGHNFYLVGRLADGATPASARAEMENLLANWRTMASALKPVVHAPDTTTHRLRIDPLQGRIVGTATTAVWVLQGAVVLVLLVACANLSTLLLSRAESRRREFAVRAALGAGRTRLLRQSIVEGCLLSTLGATLGVGVAVAGVRGLVAAFPNSLPRSGSIAIDLPVLAFTFGIALATGVVFGLAPLFHLASEQTAMALKEDGQRTTSGRHALRRALVIGEVALAVVLTVGAGLLLRTVSNLTRVDAGFNRSHLVTFGISLPAAKYATPADRKTFYARLLGELSATPGVLNAAAMAGLPPLRNVNANTTTIEGYQPGPKDPPGQVDYYQAVTTAYLNTMGIPVVEGRGFEPPDAEGEPRILINQAMARTFWPGRSAIGRRVRPCCNPATPWMTIVGVLKDVKQGGLEKAAGTELYLNADRITPSTMNVVLRTPLAPEALAATIQRVASNLDPSLPVIRLRAMDDVFDEAIGRPRLLAQLLTLFAGLALLLSAIGIYGVLSYMVTERRREIGIRMALGATPASVLRLVLGRGLFLTVAGIGIGLAIALTAGRALTSLLYGVGSTDPLTMGAVAVLIGVVALLACYMPGRSATRVDPMVALRTE